MLHIHLRYLSFSLSFIYILCGGGCSRCTQAPIPSISDSQDSALPNKPVVALSSCRPLGSLSCMGGTKTDWFFRFKGHIFNVAPASKGQVAFIGSVGSATCDERGTFQELLSLVKSAIDAKNEVKKFIWLDENRFIYWNKINKVGMGSTEWTVQAEEEIYKKLTSKKYTMHMVYLPSGGSDQDYVVSTTPFQMDRRETQPLLPNYRGIGLEAMAAIENQGTNGTGWFLKGGLTNFYPKDEKVGFLLVKEGVNPYHLVQQIITSGDEWPTQVTSFNDEMIVIPGRLRRMDPPIIGTLCNSQSPIQGGKFKILCYLIQGPHYYLSQMGHILSNVTESPLVQESVPPSITFTGNSHSLKVLDLKLYREQASGQVRDVKLSDCTIEYAVNDQVTALPPDAVVALFFLQKGTIWRTAQLESLFEASSTSNSNTSMTDDRTICLVTDVRKPLDPSCIDFFSHGKDYEYMTCVFLDHKLKFYRQREPLSIEVHEVNQTKLPKLELKETAKPNNPKITLDNTEAHVTITKTGLFKPDDVSYKLPIVHLAPSGFDLHAYRHRGFIVFIDDTNIKEDINKYITKHSEKNLYEIKKEEKYVLIFKDDVKQETLENYLHLLYQAVKSRKPKEKVSVKCDNVYISYWMQYKNELIWSERVPINMTVVPKK
ncbi:hypothetical protein [Candidatus Cardinium sp. TP]|uniref:hypothetical protein n=1 Tax=Candidatus Cardinium sp. TP TaxID=2961955 RepID=UPI0021AF1527|nr:hypothetical protein [Candidatus Cardinium sp. TP]MCT4697460.1 hypothetical protein [Candidatus Cardinium sp. TP]MDN5246958.1 hypothetical protein [Candidatus Cardinium sp.]